MRWRLRLCQICLSLVAIVWLIQPVWAAPEPPPSDRPRLTSQLLQERLRSPVASEGVRTLDLRGLVIDLRPENAAFRTQFYQGLQAQLQRPGAPLGLDLSNSLILGSLEGSQLGLRAPLFGEALAPLFTPAEQAQLQRDRRRLFQLSRLSQSLLAGDRAPRDLQLSVFRGPIKLIQARLTGEVNFSHTFFLGSIDAQGAEFVQAAHWAETRFTQPITFAGARFRQVADFGGSIFFDKASFNQIRFGGQTTFEGSEFRASASFNRSQFQHPATFSRTTWQKAADFAQTRWQDQALFAKAQLHQTFFTDAVFEKPVIFREATFNQTVNLRGASILDQIDFSDAEFAQAAMLNLPGLQFDPKQAQILGNPGQISQVLSVPTLQGNQILLRNLVRNFRQLEQIGDANQVEYLTQKLRLRDLRQQLTSTNVNQAPLERLTQIGFSAAEAEAIVQARSQHSFRNVPELLSREVIDLATFIKLQNQVTAGAPLSFWSWGLAAFEWLGLSLLLLLSQYGSSFWLIFGVGLVTIAVFGLLFWWIDRGRWWLREPILPTVAETTWMIGSFTGLALAGVVAIFRTAEAPWLTLAFLSGIILPLPLIGLLVQKQDSPTLSYFVEDGSMRQFRLLLGRLPIMPLFPFFRDRYTPILWERRWGWLNYFDLSLNNLFRLGFNDIRLRDRQLPGWISTLVWYQWGLGILYIALLLWTLSRTIPGLNLFIYF